MATQVIERSPAVKPLELGIPSSKMRRGVLAVVGAVVLAVSLGIVVQGSSDTSELAAGRIADAARYQAQADAVTDFLRGRQADAARYQAQATLFHENLTRGWDATGARYQAQADALTTGR